MAGKQAIVIILDVGHGMANDAIQPTDDLTPTQFTRSKLDHAKSAVRLLIQQKLLHTKQDVMGVVLVGTETTSNPLNEGDEDSYKHVTVGWGLQKPTLQLLEYVDSLGDVEIGSNEGDLTDALVVAMNDIQNFVGKLKYERTIYLITDGGNPIQELGDIDGIVQALNRPIAGNKTAMDPFHLNIIGFGFSDAADDDDDDDDNAKRRDDNEPIDVDDDSDSSSAPRVKREGADPNDPLSSIYVPPDPQRTDVQIENERALRYIVSKADLAQIFTPKSAIEMLSSFRRRGINQVTKLRGPMSIGVAGSTDESLMDIPIYTYSKTSMAPMPTLKKLTTHQTDKIAEQNAKRNGGGGDNDDDDDEEMPAKKAKDMGVKQERSYRNVLAENASEEIVGDQMRIKGYKYGKERVPFVEEQMAALKLATTRGISILGFMASSKIQQQLFMSTVDCIVAEPHNEKAETALSALIQAMTAKNVVMLVRYVKRNGDRPLYGCCHPAVQPGSSKDKDIELLYFNQLPYAEDQRDYAFDSLTADAKHQPSDPQSVAARDFVRQLDLMSGALDDEGNPKEALEPELTFNPVLQHFYQCVEKRALDPSAAIDELDPIIRAYVHPDEALQTRAKDAITNFKQQFLLQRVEDKAKKRRHWRDYLEVQPSDDILDAAKRARAMADGEQKDDATGANRYESIVRRQVNDVESVDPVNDFRAMLARNEVDVTNKAVTQMKDLIIRLVNTSLSDSQYDKAFACLKELRAGCVQHQLPADFNSYLTELIAKFKTTRGKTGFVRMMADNQLIPITSDEATGSDIQPAEAEAFWEKDFSNAAPDMGADERQHADEDDGDIFESME